MLIKDFSYYSLGTILPKASGLILLPIYTKYLGPNEFGIVGAMTTFVAFFSIIITLNFERSIFRLIYDYKNKNDIKSFLGTITLWVFIFSTFILISCIFFQNLISSLFKSISFYPYFLISILTVYFNTFGNIPRIYLQVQQKSKHFVILGLIQFLITNFFIIIFVVAFEMKATGYLLGGLISSLLLFPYFIVYTLKRIIIKFNFKVFYNIAKFSLPLIPAIISVQIIDLSDRIFIENILSSFELGIYSLAYTIAGILLVFTAAFKKAYDPFFYKVANESKEIEAKFILEKTNTIYFILILFICFSISIFSKELVLIFFDSNFQPAYEIVPLLCLSYAINKISGLINLSFYQKKNTHTIMYITVFAALINLILNYFLILKYGYIGAAYSTLITCLFIFGFKYVISKKFYYIKINFTKLLIYISFFLLVFFLFEKIEVDIIMSIIMKSLFILLSLLLIFFTEKKNYQIIKKHV